MNSLKKQLFQTYWKAESALVPGLTTSQHSYYLKLRQLVSGKVWLDLGCGHQVFTEWMEKEQEEVISSCKSVYGIDLDWLGLKGHNSIRNKVFGNLEHLPFQEDAVEIVTANMVVEHLARPGKILNEIYRCLRPGGHFLFHTPNFNGWATRTANRMPEAIKKKLIWALEGRKEEDVFPTHYKMNTAESIRDLAAKSGFISEEINLVSSSAVTAPFGPLAVPELLYIRSLQSEHLAGRRSNVIATLLKP